MKAGLRYGFEKQPPIRTLMIQIQEWVGDGVREFSQLLTSHNFRVLTTLTTVPLMLIKQTILWP